MVTSFANTCPQFKQALSLEMCVVLKVRKCCYGNRHKKISRQSACLTAGHTQASQTLHAALALGLGTASILKASILKVRKTFLWRLRKQRVLEFDAARFAGARFVATNIECGESFEIEPKIGEKPPPHPRKKKLSRQDRTLYEKKRC